MPVSEPEVFEGKVAYPKERFYKTVTAIISNSIPSLIRLVASLDIIISLMRNIWTWDSSDGGHRIKSQDTKYYIYLTLLRNS